MQEFARDDMLHLGIEHAISLIEQKAGCSGPAFEWSKTLGDFRDDFFFPSSPPPPGTPLGFFLSPGETAGILPFGCYLYTSTH